MGTLLRRLTLSVTIVYCSLVFPIFAGIAHGAEDATPPVSEIPGLTADDLFPRGCVDCHIDMPQIKQDERLSSVMSSWDRQVPPELVEKARSIARDGEAIKGRHPLSVEMFQDIPENCQRCHKKGPGSVVPLGPLIHLIHLSGGQNNHYFTIFQGHCTHCHKFDLNTGIFNLPSAQEQ